MSRVVLCLLGCGMLIAGVAACGDRGQCPNQCVFQQQICRSGQLFRCEQSVADGCPYWALVLCPKGCDQSSGVARCVGSTPPPDGPPPSDRSCAQAQFRKGCVGHDVHWFDDCGNPRAKISTCPTTAPCQQGACRSAQCPGACTPEATRCNGAGIELCKVVQGSQCPTWTPYSTCLQPYTCQEGRCVKEDKGCEDQCQEGQGLCAGAGISRCQRGADGCTRWSPAVACPAGQRCRNNACVDDAPQTSACCVNQACQDLTSAACQQLGGQWHDGKACAQVNCQPAPPQAACCQGTSCAMQTAQSCQQGGGVFHQGKQCSDNPCGSSSGGSCGSKGSGGDLRSRKDWPCSGCYFAVPSGYSHSKPTPLVVALHGDEGRADYIYQVFKPSVTAEGWLLVSLRCPRDKGCNGSWWRWRDQSRSHDPTWVNGMVDQVEKSYNIDRKRVYLTGWSGGSSYNSTHATLHADRYAAVNYNSGGHSFSTCPKCKIPAYYYIGTNDFLLSSARKGESKYKSCGGHKVVFDLLQGVDHQGISRRLSQGGAAKIVQWFKANPTSASNVPRSGRLCISTQVSLHHPVPLRTGDWWSFWSAWGPSLPP